MIEFHSLKPETHMILYCLWFHLHDILRKSKIYRQENSSARDFVGVMELLYVLIRLGIQDNMYLSKFTELCTKKVDLSCIQLLYLPDDMILFIKYILSKLKTVLQIIPSRKCRHIHTIKKIYLQIICLIMDCIMNI